jgi:hypothetical protein
MDAPIYCFTLGFDQLRRVKERMKYLSLLIEIPLVNIECYRILNDYY